VSGSNTIIITGRIARDPEVRQTQSGREVVSFSLPTENYRKQTTWWSCSAWGSSGLALAEHCKAGRWVTITGTASEREWVDAQGQKRSRVEVDVRDWSFVGPKQQLPSDGMPAPQRHSPDSMPAPQRHQQTGGAPNPNFFNDDDLPF
jgi:single-strand DNA-binding protein